MKRQIDRLALLIAVIFVIAVSVVLQLVEIIHDLIVARGDYVWGVGVLIVVGAIAVFAVYEVHDYLTQQGNYKQDDDYED